MKLITRFVIIGGALFTASHSFAALLQPIIQNQQLGFSLSDVAWPASLAKDLGSGFENRILVRIAAVENEETISRTAVLIIEKYDLWDELFRVRVLVAGVVRSDKSINHIEEVMTLLRSLIITDMVALNALPQDQNVMLQADILINPVDREKVERLNQWVAENSAPRLPGQGAATLTAKPNSLFNKIYDQYVHGADLSAPWRISIASLPFRVQKAQLEPLHQ